MVLPSLVSTDWLNDNLDNTKLVLLDATLAKPKSAGELPHQDVMIPGAQFFDIDGAFSDSSFSLPHMMCDESQFEVAIQKLGVDEDSLIIVYDSHGVYSAPRAWWMMKSMGMDHVAVLNGGLPEWIDKGFPVVEKETILTQPGSIQPSFDSSYFVDAAHVLNEIDNKEVAVLDARSAGRFKGTVPEPRAGLRSGHIPNSISLPFTEVIEGYRMKDNSALAQLFEQWGLAGKKLIFSCGSGLTACIILLAAHLAGYEELTVYDGSWSEWGQLSDLPVNR